MNTVVANTLQNYLGEKDVATTVTPETRPGETMLALVWHGKRNVSVESVPIPKVTDPTDVVCKVTGSTVCGSDLHLYHQEILQLKDGDILGHEWMGVVDEVGSEVKTLKKGDRVVASFQIA
jgi:threonine dehydrogenase-like Zn-dependent dehydrogenase